MREQDQRFLNETFEPAAQNIEEYRNSKWWKYMRAERKKIAHDCCEMCGRAESEVGHLELHHLGNPYPEWYSEDIEKDVAMLCPVCHGFVTFLQDENMSGSVPECVQRIQDKAEGALAILESNLTSNLAWYVRQQLRGNNIVIPSKNSRIATTIICNAMQGRNSKERWFPLTPMYGMSLDKMALYQKVQQGIAEERRRNE